MNRRRRHLPLRRTRLPGLFGAALFLTAALFFHVVVPVRAASQTDDRPERNGFRAEQNQAVSMGRFTFQLPSYWEEDTSRPGSYYAETGGKSAYLLMVESDFPLEHLQFLQKPVRILNEINEGMHPSAYSVIDLGSIQGVPVVCEAMEGFTPDPETGPLSYEGYLVIYYDLDQMVSVMLGCLYSDNTTFRYGRDFWRTALSVSAAPPAALFHEALSRHRTFFSEYRAFLDACEQVKDAGLFWPDPARTAYEELFQRHRDAFLSYDYSHLPAEDQEYFLEVLAEAADLLGQGEVFLCPTGTKKNVPLSQC